MAEAEILGITGLGTISPPGVLLSAGAPKPSIGAALEPLLPPTSDRLLLQADLTATATAPLTARTERRLARAADFVSGGGATVYRFTHESIARALAHGEHAEALLEWLGEIADTEIPRAIPVLLNDVAREQGDVRIVAATAALTGDPDTLNELLSSPALARAGLTQLSATALTATVAPNELRSMLRSAGIRVDESRDAAEPTQPEQDEPAQGLETGGDPGLRARVVTALLEIETALSDRDSPPSPPSAPAPLGAARLTRTLRETTESGAEVWLEFSDAGWSMQTHLIMPIDLAGGTATVLNRTQNAIQSIPLSRILGVTLAQEQDHAP